MQKKFPNIAVMLSIGLLTSVNLSYAEQSSMVQVTAKAISWGTINTSTGLISNNIKQLHTEEGRLYAVSDMGLSISNDDGLLWQNLYLNDINVSITRINDIDSSNESVYLATDRGLLISYNQGQHWQIKGLSLQEKLSLPTLIINAVSVVDGIIYVATAKGLGVSYDGGDNWDVYDKKDGLVHTYIYDVVVTDRNIYLATRAGMFGSTLSDMKFKHYDTPSGYLVNKLYVDGSSIYGATDNGVLYSHHKGGSWQLKTTSDGLPDNLITGVTALGAKLAVSTANGAAFSADGGESWYIQNEQTGLASDYTSNIAFAQGKLVYISTDNGISKAEAQEVWPYAYVPSYIGNGGCTSNPHGGETTKRACLKVGEKLSLQLVETEGNSRMRFVDIKQDNIKLLDGQTVVWEKIKSGKGYPIKSIPVGKNTKLEDIEYTLTSNDVSHIIRLCFYKTGGVYGVDYSQSQNCSDPYYGHTWYPQGFWWSSSSPSAYVK